MENQKCSFKNIADEKFSLKNSNESQNYSFQSEYFFENVGKDKDFLTNIDYIEKIECGFINRIQVEEEIKNEYQMLNDENCHNEINDGKKLINCHCNDDINGSFSYKDKSFNRVIFVQKKLGKCGFSIKNYSIFNNYTQTSFSLTYISYVEIGSPAHISGLNKGDIVLCINNCKLSSFCYARIDDILKLATTLKLVVNEDNFNTINLIKKQIKLQNKLNAKMQAMKKLNDMENSILKNDLNDTNAPVTNIQIEPHWSIIRCTPASTSPTPYIPSSSQVNTQFNETQKYDVTNKNRLPKYKKDLLNKQSTKFSIPNGYSTISGIPSKFLDSSPYVSKKNNSLRSLKSINVDSKVTSLMRKILRPSPSIQKTSKWYLSSDSQQFEYKEADEIDDLYGAEYSLNESVDTSLSIDSNNNGGSISLHSSIQDSGEGDLKIRDSFYTKRYFSTPRTKLKEKRSSTGIEIGLRIIYNGIGSMFDLSSLNEHEPAIITKVLSEHDINNSSNHQLQITKL